jgi:hypothetical protein
VGPTFWPKRQYPQDKYEQNYRHGHLHEAKLRGVFCHKPARHKSRDDQKPSGNPTDHERSSSISGLKNRHNRTIEHAMNSLGEAFNQFAPWSNSLVRPGLRVRPSPI